jgi:hypothetical protein
MALAAMVGTGFCSAADDNPLSTPRTTELIARFRDGTTIRRITLQESLEMQTKYGTLTVPMSAIRRVEFGRHTSEETRKQIADSVKQLGGADFQQREAASKSLIALGASAYPALVEAAKSSDQEVARRAQMAVLTIRERIPEEELRIPEFDVIHTGDCVLSGHLVSPILKGKTANFGELPMKLADLRSVHALSEARLSVDASKHSTFGHWDGHGHRGGWRSRAGDRRLWQGGLGPSAGRPACLRSERLHGGCDRSCRDWRTGVPGRDVGRPHRRPG